MAIKWIPPPTGNWKLSTNGSNWGNTSQNDYYNFCYFLFSLSAVSLAPFSFFSQVLFLLGDLVSQLGQTTSPN